MICFWQHAARIASGKASYPSLLKSSSRPIVRTLPFSISSAQHASAIPLSAFRDTSTTPLLTKNSQQYQLFDPVPMDTPSSSFAEPLQPPIMEQSLTPAQTSRAASTAIHHSLQNGRLADAYLILNSIRYANIVKSKPASAKVPWTRLSIDDYARVAIQFEQVVPMRLPWHALIHDLLRLGLSKKAAKLTRELMQNGIKIRRKTFEVVMESITRSSGLLPNRPAFLENVIDTHEILQLSSSMASDGTTRFALQLLEIADTHRNERSRSMFNKLIILCIINGEIILASLLYGFMARSEKKKHAEQAAPAISVNGVDKKEKFSRHFHYNNTESLRPSPNLLARMCKLIERRLIDDSASYTQLQARSALQALTNLAQLVDHDKLSVGIAPLLKTMRSTPQTKHRTWIRDTSGAPKLVHGSSYVHGVCDKLIKELSTKPDAAANAGKKHDIASSPIPTRKLHRNARNALLNQYICGRLPMSSILKLLEAEMNEPELHVDSMNILLKATHLRDESAKALGILQLDGPPKTAIMKLAKQITGNPHHIPYDTYTVVAYVKKAAAQHDLRALKNLVFELFPELRNEYHATTYSQMSRERALKAASLGPYIITTMLQLLYYTRDYERAHRLWCLSKVAQYTSWKPDTPPNIKPWRLPIQAYTIMIQCYARKFDQKSSNLTWETSSMKHLAYYRQSGRQLIMDLYRSMDFKKPYNKPSPAVQTPEPDLFFFKTMLKALAPPVDMRFKTAKEREDYFTHRVKISEVEFARCGRVSGSSPPELHEIMEDMLLEQFSIPLEYRYLFVGRR